MWSQFQQSLFGRALASSLSSQIADQLADFLIELRGRFRRFGCRNLRHTIGRRSDCKRGRKYGDLCQVAHKRSGKKHCQYTPSDSVRSFLHGFQMQSNWWDVSRCASVWYARICKLEIVQKSMLSLGKFST